MVRENVHFTLCARARVCVCALAYARAMDVCGKGMSWSGE